MSLEVVRGESRNRAIAQALIEQIAAVVQSGTVYLGYPVLASADDKVQVDALLVSEEHGLVAFQYADNNPADAADMQRYVDQQDRLYAVLDSNLRRHDGLRRGRGLRVEINTATVFPTAVDAPDVADGIYCGMAEVADRLAVLPPLEPDAMEALHAALQRVSTIKPAKKRESVTGTSSRGAKIKQIEKGIANLDAWQKRAAIENPDGPQRIRGLAGSGKTVVLALKAAYLHSYYPDWKIAVTFHSRALYQQIQDLVTRFSFEHSNDAPNFERLRIMHSWGSARRAGIYSEIATALNAPVRDWAFARSAFGSDDAFSGVCDELLSIARQSKVEPIYDAVLIDEAQDLPPSFFKLVYMFTKEPKRVVWGYDELQRLSEGAMPTMEELFGTNEAGENLVSLEDVPGEARRDITLPVCYRNTPWALATAHALGFGIYRHDGPIQHFDDPQTWLDIGYRPVSGVLQAGRSVELERQAGSYPAYFTELLEPNDAVQFHRFGNETEQDTWLAHSILNDLHAEELEPDDILIVLPNTYTSKRRYSSVARALHTVGVASHLAGVSTSLDELFVPNSVAVAHIFRAKGNEAPMVYVLDAQHASLGPDRITRRNTLFTAVTRSRAWVRICSYGPSADEVATEAQEIEARQFRLAFRVPSPAELSVMRRLHRDKAAGDPEKARHAAQVVGQLLDAFDQGELDIDDLPPDLRSRLRSRLSEADADEPDV